MKNEILIVDIETTGLFKDGGLIVEIGIVKLNLETGKIVPVYNSLIKEKGLDISHTKEPFGWIFKNSDLNFCELENAPDLESQKEVIQALFNDYSATAYNKEFDFYFLKDRGFRINELICPMWVADPLLNIIEEDFIFDKKDPDIIWEVYNYKWPSVEEVWKYLFNDSYYFEKHSGLNDAIDEAKIVYKLFLLGKYKVARVNENNTNENELSLPTIYSNEYLTPELYSETLKVDRRKSDLPGLIPFRKGNKWGVCNMHGQLIIDCIFDSVERFYNGFAKVKLNDKWGFINEDGHVVISIKYDEVKEFYQGLAAVKTENKWGYLDKNGDFIIPPLFIDAYNFSDNRAAIIYKKDQSKQMYDDSNLRIGFIDQNGVKVTNNEYFIEDWEINRSSQNYIFKNGRALVIYREVTRNSFSEKRYGFIDLNGCEIIPCKYKMAFEFSEGFARCQDSGIFRGYIDFIGNEYEINYPKFGNFEEGLALYKRRNGEGFISTNFEEVIDPIYNEVSSFHEGYARVREGNKIEWGFINKNNEIVTPCKYRELGNYSEELAAFKISLNKWGFINLNGVEVISAKYNNVGEFQKGIAKVLCNDIIRKNYGFIDKYGVEYWED